MIVHDYAGVTLLQGDVRACLAELAPESVQVVVTSPPYWGLRNYGLPPSVFGRDAACDHVWSVVRSTLEQGNKRNPVDLDRPRDRSGDKGAPTTSAIESGVCERCSAWRGVLGLEPTPYLYVEHVVEVLRAVHRVLRKDGIVWLNLGDCYAGGKRGARWRGEVTRHRDDKRRDHGRPVMNGRGEQQRMPTKNVRPMTQQNRMPIPGLKPKDLVGAPWRVALAAQADGWWLRADVVWAKGVSFCPTYSGSVMPESVTDRPTRSHEYLFLLTKAERYFSNFDAIREVATMAQEIVYDNGADGHGGGASHAGQGTSTRKFRSGRSVPVEGVTRNVRSVWTISPKPFAESHFATFPPALVEPCIKASSRPGDLVLDPFSGAGTTGLVATRLGRRYVGIDLNPEYVAMSRRRIVGLAPLFLAPPEGM